VERKPEPVGVVGVPLDISLDLSLGSEFFVNALSSRVRTVGDLQIRAFDGVAKVYGQVALSRGVIRIPFYDASFRVRQGLAIFDGPLVPRLEEVEAVADLGGYRITARANGRYPDTFSLDLYSDPPLPQSELSRIAILGGLPPAVTSATDPNSSQSALGTLGATGASFLSGMLTNRLTEQIANTFFLSELSFDYIPPATYAVKIAKALDPNDRFLLTVTRIIRDSGQNENLYGIEWRFTRSFLLRTAFDQLARFRFWVQSINRF
jgi:autotransporter translocation and assembly factor TamB